MLSLLQGVGDCWRQDVRVLCLGFLTPIPRPPTNMENRSHVGQQVSTRFPSRSSTNQISLPLPYICWREPFPLDVSCFTSLQKDGLPAACVTQAPKPEPNTAFLGNGWHGFAGVHPRTLQSPSQAQSNISGTGVPRREHHPACATAAKNRSKY